jgi:hypothetical protein
MAYLADTRIPFPKLSLEYHCHHPPHYLLVPSRKSNQWTEVYTAMKSAQRISCLCLHHNTHFLRHLQHGIPALQDLSVSLQLLHRCRRTLQLPFYLGTRIEQNRPAHYKADRQSLDIRHRTRLAPAILMRSLLFASLPHPHPRLPQSLPTEAGTRRSRHSTDLLHYHKALHLIFAVKLLLSSPIWSISRQSRYHPFVGRRGRAEMVLPSLWDFVAHPQ